MKKLIGALGVVLHVLLLPEFRPMEVRILKAVALAVAAYFGVKEVA